MKIFCPNTRYLFFTFVLFFAARLSDVHAQDNIQSLDEGYYLVVGAFNIKSNAERYSAFINDQKGENSKVGLNDQIGVYFVYVVDTDDLELAKKHWKAYRERPEFADAWVFKNFPSSNENFVNIENQEAVEAEETSDGEIFEDPTENQPEQPKPEIDVPELADDDTPENMYKYVFNVINATTYKEVPGYVTVVDAARNQVMTSVETNKVQLVPEPTTVTKEVIFICDIFGYVKQQVDLKIDEPLQSGDPNVAVSGDTTFVSFELFRYDKGDIITMYNVYFYNDAAIMKPESKFELNSLLDMLQENEDLKIRIHGHTNGNAPGKIISLKEDDNNFFEVTDNNIDGYGSAKKLSEERGKTIKKWLVEQGIDENRMSIKGWGGKKMLYDKTSASARNNVRVEIEIMKN